METGFVAIAVVAVTELKKRTMAKDWDGVITILSAAAIGGLAGWLGLHGLDILTGVTAGLAASGIHTVAKQI